MSIRHIHKPHELPPIDIVIPAAGLGRRMKSYGPKPLIQIKNNTTILANQLKLFRKVLPASNIILVTGFDADRLMNNTPSEIVKVENERYEDTNVVRSLGMGLRACKRDVLVVYGDLVFNEYALRTIDYNHSSILVGDEIMGDKEVGCIVNKKGGLENMMYDLPVKWGQMGFFKGRELKLLKEFCWNPIYYSRFGFEAINHIVSNGGKVAGCYDKKARVIDIDTNKDLERVGTVI
jgi:choline kinase